MRSHSLSLTQLTLALFMLIHSKAVFAGIPYQTDDPIPVDWGHFELDFASQHVDTHAGQSGTLPSVGLDYGATAHLQLHLLVPLAFNHAPDQRVQRGLGDVELGAKYQFVQEKDNLPAMAISPDVLIPSGDARKGLGNGALQYELPLLLQKNWGNWQTNAGIAYWINRAAHMKNYWAFGWQLQRNLSDQLTVGGELYYQTEQQHQQGADAGFNVGSIYNIDSHNHLLFSIGRGLSNIKSNNARSTYIAYQRTW